MFQKTSAGWFSLKGEREKVRGGGEFLCNVPHPTLQSGSDLKLDPREGACWGWGSFREEKNCVGVNFTKVTPIVSGGGEEWPTGEWAQSPPQAAVPVPAGSGAGGGHLREGAIRTPPQKLFVRVSSCSAKYFSHGVFPCLRSRSVFVFKTHGVSITCF